MIRVQFFLYLLHCGLKNLTTLIKNTKCYWQSGRVTKIIIKSFLIIDHRIVLRDVVRVNEIFQQLLFYFLRIILVLTTKILQLLSNLGHGFSKEIHPRLAINVPRCWPDSRKIIHS